MAFRVQPEVQASVFSALASLPRQATTGNTSALARLNVFCKSHIFPARESKRLSDTYSMQARFNLDLTTTVQPL